MTVTKNPQETNTKRRFKVLVQTRNFDDQYESEWDETENDAQWRATQGLLLDVMAGDRDAINITQPNGYIVFLRSSDITNIELLHEVVENAQVPVQG